ncbi:sphinganine-1-phosphate aldolase DPL1 [Ascoidea rubescens DSM 1968]|uniref:sphinganine-1-phosphate aldolase n=1 Tax=Ascoidea rubescens DSM 1968 TaxID=1344418 RepID=A0A1D2VC16_9ASCO|nr:sphingosine-1-phosphate lyase [Ascoidea rubescens DSM 1968]ODV59155.1 sphingosine-1-phosphate lyase [Ascoidea rubescens DSM 1968]
MENLSLIGNYKIHLIQNISDITDNVNIVNNIIDEYWNEFGIKFISLSLIKDSIFIFFLTNLVLKLFGIVLQLLNNIYSHGLRNTIHFHYKKLSKKIFKTIFLIPSIKRRIDSEINESLEKLENQLVVSSNGNEKFRDFFKIPHKSLSDEEIFNELNIYEKFKHSDWENGKVSGAVYHGGKEIIGLQSRAFKQYCVANQLHPNVFPGVRKMESEIVSMVINLFNGSTKEEYCGTTTSGGTESLILACYSAKNYGYKYKNICAPEIIAPISIHAGIDKACSYFNIKLHKVELDPVSYKVDLRRVKRLINKNTVLICGSAPNFPHGIVDDIKGLSELGTKYDVPVHVDCCLGSFIISYMEKSGFKDEIPVFDFRLKGVTSISCDTHKYGFAPKGSSIIMYKNKKLRECQYYVSTDWVGGIYGSPTIAGSRPGALMVGCWVTLLKFGDEGYIKSCQEIIKASRKLKKSIVEDEDLNKDLELIGDPMLSVISFKSQSINVYELSDILNKKGWELSSIQKPPGLHIALTALTVPVIEELVEDMKMGIRELKARQRENGEANKGAQSDTAVLYGIAGSIKTPGIVDRLVVGFIDTLYKPAQDV